MWILNRNYVMSVCIVLYGATSGLSPPQYVSDWILMDANDPSTTYHTFTHNFGVYPYKVEVQVKSQTKGFIYPGIKSAFGGNDYNARGGVISLYDESDIKVYGATNENNENGNAYIIYTGYNSWTPENREQSVTGLVRVRAWHPDDFPAPTNTFTINMKAGNSIWNDYETVFHGLGSIPVLTVVQFKSAWTTDLSNWMSEGQGISGHVTGDSSLYWGGLVYGVGTNNIRLWAPSNDGSNYGIFNFCDGWGYHDNGAGSSCSYIRANVIVRVWTDLETTEIFSGSGAHDTTDSGNTHEYVIPSAFNSAADLFSVHLEAVDGSNNGYHFEGIGAAILDSVSGCGGLIYAYDDVTNAIRVWHPVSSNTYLIHIDSMGGGTNNQLSTSANVHIKIWKAPTTTTATSSTTPSTTTATSSTTPSTTTATSSTTPSTTTATSSTTPSTTTTSAVTTTQTNYCSFPDSGVNAALTLSSLSVGSTLTYSCLSGYSHVSGDTSRVCISLGSSVAWGGSAIECQILCSDPDITSNVLYAVSSATLLLGTSVTYACTGSNVHTAGDMSRVCHSSGIWTGTAPTCSSVSTTVDQQVCFNVTIVVDTVEVEKIAEEIVANLTVPSKKTSKYQRSLTSATDERTSSALIGLLGAVICGVVLGLMVIPDIGNVIRHVFCPPEHI